jgi:hypothetical protein
MRIDGHVHTCYSPDSLLKPETICRLITKRRIDAVAVTDHQTIAGALELQRMAPALPVIIGEEITTRQGELIGLFLRETIPAGLDALETIDWIHHQDGLAVLPHPGDRLRRKKLDPACWEKVLPRIDLVEGFNGRTVFYADDRKARELAVCFHKPVYAGSDCHTAWEFGRCGMELAAWTTPATFLEASKAAGYFGKYTPLWPHLVTKVVKKFKV